MFIVRSQYYPCPRLPIPEEAKGIVNSNRLFLSTGHVSREKGNVTLERMRDVVLSVCMVKSRENKIVRDSLAKRI